MCSHKLEIQELFEYAVTRPAAAPSSISEKYLEKAAPSSTSPVSNERLPGTLAPETQPHRFRKDELTPGQSRRASVLVKLSDDPFPTTLKALLLCAQHNIEPSAESVVEPAPHRRAEPEWRNWIEELARARVGAPRYRIQSVPLPVTSWCRYFPLTSIYFL